MRINRTVPFDVTAFLGWDHSIAEQDGRSLALTEIDLSRVELVHMLKDGEPFVEGRELLRRHERKTNYIPLDAKVFQYCLEHPDQIPEIWKQKLSIDFLGTVFRHSQNRSVFGTLLRYQRRRYGILRLCWDRQRERWYWTYMRLDLLFATASNPSAVLAR